MRTFSALFGAAHAVPAGLSREAEVHEAKAYNFAGHRRDFVAALEDWISLRSPVISAASLALFTAFGWRNANRRTFAVIGRKEPELR
jgi:hypothetical protein